MRDHSPVYSHSHSILILRRLLGHALLSRYQLPPILFHADDRWEYYGALEQADVGNLRPFLRFSLRQMGKTAARIRRRWDEFVVAAEVEAAVKRKSAATDSRTTAGQEPAAHQERKK
jgi:hypothetical protein